MDQSVLNIKISEGFLRIIQNDASQNYNDRLFDYSTWIRDSVIIGKIGDSFPQPQKHMFYSNVILEQPESDGISLLGYEFVPVEGNWSSLDPEKNASAIKSGEYRTISPPPTFNKLLFPEAAGRIPLKFDDIAPRTGESRFKGVSVDLSTDSQTIKGEKDLMLNKMSLDMNTLLDNKIPNVSSGLTRKDLEADTDFTSYNIDDFFVQTDLGLVRYGGETIDSRLINKSWANARFVKIPILIEYQVNGLKIIYDKDNDEEKKYEGSSSNAVIKEEIAEKIIKIFNYIEKDKTTKRDDSDGARVDNAGKSLPTKEYDDKAANGRKNSFTYIKKSAYIKNLSEKSKTFFQAEGDDCGCGYIISPSGNITLQFNPEITGESRSANWNGITALGKNHETFYWSNTNAKTIQFKTTYAIMMPDEQTGDWVKSPPWFRDIYNEGNSEDKSRNQGGGPTAYNKLYDQWGKKWTEPYVLNTLNKYERLMYGYKKDKFKNGNRISPPFIQIKFGSYFQTSYSSIKSFEKAFWTVSDCSIDARQELGYTASRNNFIYDVTLTLKEFIDSSFRGSKELGSKFFVKR
jgi:hypothetical protein